MQTTLASSIRCAGIGLHTGAVVRMKLTPAEAGQGITFRRTDAGTGAAGMPARFDRVTGTQLGTTLTGDDGSTIATVEHLMSAFLGLGIDNAAIEIDGPEVPIMDGSASSFVFLLDCAGIAETGVPRQALRVTKPVEIREGNKLARLEPADEFSVDFTIDFTSRAIGRQAFTAVVTPASFRMEIARARTFGFAHEVSQLQSMGLARGGSLDNAIVIDGDTVMNEGPLRFANEFARHKALDAIGDLALAGYPLRARYVAERAGHALNNALLRRLFAEPDAFVLEIEPMASAAEAPAPATSPTGG